jgi:anti-sigma regulatory factor (Ser/Thr protein kinase)
MRKPREKSLKIRNFILENVGSHPRDITTFTSITFDISRNAVLRHMNKLIDEGAIDVSGSTKDRSYELKVISKEIFSFEISPEIEEDRIWRHIIRPKLLKIPENVLRICEYGLSEMINNVIDHSEGTESIIHINQFMPRLEFMVADNGIGIFNKIQRDIGFTDPRHAILELAKGKLTTDPSRHTGEGIFFTSRMFDDFVILSEGLFFSHNEPGDDWLIEHDSDVKGTTVSMGIALDSKREIQDVFNAYTSEEQDYGFMKTHVPLSLATYGDENLISRSQARRLLARFHQFQEVLLDFQEVESIGQAFADEIYRIYARNNPEVNIISINTNDQIKKMIKRAEEHT